MPWQERSSESLRAELVALCRAEGANVSELCRRFGVSRKTAYKWLARADLGDRDRRPRACPRRSPPEVEAAALSVRDAHPTWGGRKIRAALLASGAGRVPAASTIAGILRRHGRLEGPRAGGPREWERFERAAPNELWQMDFKGHFATLSGRCHPLTLLDDRSRFSLGVWACADERGETVRPFLEGAFRRYGMPLAILCDNGGPWAARGGLSALEAWLLRLGVRPLHGRPRHPQTQGKLERLHRTLLADAVAGRSFAGLTECQAAFDRWRDAYNRLRPHEALGMATPASRYAASPRPFPERLPEPEHAPGDLVRRVQRGGWTSLLGRELRLGDGLVGHPVAFRPGPEDGLYEVRFCGRSLGWTDLREDRPTVTHVSERV